MLHQGEYESAAGGGTVEYRVITPPDWTRAEHLPLLTVLHGAGSSAATLDAQVDDFEESWSVGDLPRVVVACASTPTVGGFYIDRPDGGGRWETLVGDEFPALVAAEWNVDRAHALLLGSSMGGYGALKVAFRYPERFVAVAAVSPAIFPAESMAAVRPRNALGVLHELAAAMANGTGDERAYTRNDVVARLRANVEAIRASGIAILVDCGDDDMFNLHDGAEYLHRVLWDLDVSHEYHLVCNADHVGPEAVTRQRTARRFLGRALTDRRHPPAPMPADDPAATDPYSQAGVVAIRSMIASTRADAAARDDTMARRYGVLPGE